MALALITVCYLQASFLSNIIYERTLAFTYNVEQRNKYYVCTNGDIVFSPIKILDMKSVRWTTSINVDCLTYFYTQNLMMIVAFDKCRFVTIGGRMEAMRPTGLPSYNHDN